MGLSRRTWSESDQNETECYMTFRHVTPDRMQGVTRYFVDVHTYRSRAAYLRYSDRVKASLKAGDAVPRDPARIQTVEMDEGETRSFLEACLKIHEDEHPVEAMWRAAYLALSSRFPDSEAVIEEGQKSEPAREPLVRVVIS